MSALQSPKPFKTLPELVELLRERGMTISDVDRAERKLAQVGYYRLSGYWYVCRELRNSTSDSSVSQRLEQFLPNTHFDKVFELYLMDKKLRLIMLDAIERIEVNVRTVIAHEMGYHDPMAHENAKFINPRQIRDYVDRQKSQRNAWREWLARHQKQINQSKEDSVVWHRAQNKSMPIWVVCEAWDFGTVSKYFEILKQTHQNRIAKRLGVDNPKVLVAWLHEISTLRNRCAHHCRVWNQKTSNALPDATSVDFARFVMAGEASSRLYGLIAVIAFLLRNIGPNSGWLDQVADALATKPDLPGVTYSAMGMYESIGVSTRLFIE